MPSHQELSLDRAGEPAGEVERERGGSLGVELVAIGGRAGEIRRKMECAIREAARERDAGVRVGLGPHPPARHGVAIVVVEVVDPVGRPARHCRRPAHRVAAAECVGLPAKRAVGARLSVRTHRGASSAVPRHDLDHTGDRIRSVQDAARAADDLDPVDVVGGQIGEVVSATRLIDRHAVDQDLHVVALPAAEKERRLRTEPASLHHLRAGHLPERVSHRANPLRAKIVAAKHRHGNAHRVGTHRISRRRDHDLGKEGGVTRLLGVERGGCEQEGGAGPHCRESRSSADHGDVSWSGFNAAPARAGAGGPRRRPALGDWGG